MSRLFSTSTLLLVANDCCRDAVSMRNDEIVVLHVVYV